MKKLFMIAAIALLAVACNKDQAAVKKLDGTWKATSVKISFGGLTIDAMPTFITSVTMTFDGCKLKTDEFCNVTTVTTYPDGVPTETDAAQYRVVGDGEKIEMRDDPSSTTITSATINELTKTSCTITMTEGSGEETSTSVIVLEKE
jgi:hypothetical protein